MARSFNTAHANNAAENYTLPPLARLPPDVEQLAHDKFYFVLHAPRQSGKTTTVMALAEKLRQDGRYAVVFCTVEDARAVHDVGEVVQLVVDSLRSASDKLPATDAPPAEPPDAPQVPRNRLYRFLKAWAQACPRPLVLFIDEIDCLENDGLISVLSQLRKGYAERPKGFPHSVCIFGMRDVRDYKVATGGSTTLGTSSPFNIKRESITLATFTRCEIAELYGQHTAETGQGFTEDAIDRALLWTGGQPHLVNALANDIVAKQQWTATIDVPQIDAAKERIVLQWGTHFDSLMARLREDRVRRVIQPLLAGAVTPFDVEDLRFCRDLGLIDGSRPPQIANAIYREVIARKLTANLQAGIPQAPHRWRTADGRFDIDKVRDGLVAFWLEHAESFVQQEDYHEVAVHLMAMAYLQAAVNGGGHVEREYAAGTKRMDILIKWPVADERGVVDLYGTRFERHLFELKVWYAKKGDPKPEGLAQLDQYLQRIPCESASLLIFDRRPETEALEWGERVLVEAERPEVQGVGVWVWRA